MIINEYFPGLGLPSVLREMRGNPDIYIRFGDYHSDVTEHSMNWATGEYERGTSVYPAVMVDGFADIHADWEWALWDSREVLSERRVWVLTGKKICEGADGEPVLQTSSIVARKVPVNIGIRQAFDR